MKTFHRTLVKLPASAEETVLAFPALKLLQSLPEREIFIIADQGNGILLDALECDEERRAKVFELPLHKKNIWGAHHYAMNQHEIFNIDEFYDFESSATSAILGLTFKGRQRQGFERGWLQKVSYQRKTPWQSSWPADANYVRLICEGTGLSDRQAYLEVIPSTVTPLTKYLFVALKGLYTPALRDQYLEYIHGFDHTSFIFWDLDGELGAAFFEGLHPRLEYKILRSPSPADIAGVVKTSVGLITNQAWMAWLGPYWGVRTLGLDHQLARSCYFDLNPTSIPMNDVGEALSFTHNYFSL